MPIYAPQPNCLICSKPSKWNIKHPQRWSETCGQSCQAKLTRQRLRNDPVKFAAFVENTKKAVTKVWEGRDDEERRSILTGAWNGFQTMLDATPKDEQYKLFSRYHKCDEATILRLNTQGAIQCMQFDSGGWGMTFKGNFRPKNLHKYKGDFTKITHRSGWERQVFKYIDENPAIVEWSSEEVIVKYISPKDSRVHRYYPDIWLKVQRPDGTTKEYLWEIKPASQSVPPVPKTREQVLTETKAGKRRYYMQVINWGVNDAKWKAARAYCEERGWTFQVVTEKELPFMAGKRKK